MALHGQREDSFTKVRNADHDGAFHVVDGVRSSYQASDPHLVVWFLGGSTTFGIGQRDEHTIPSEVGRLAEADGHPIRVENLGVSAWSTWQEVIELQRRLDTEPAPDLVVFLDGVNDYSLFCELVDQGRDTRWPAIIGDTDAYPGPRTADHKPRGTPARYQELTRYARALNRSWEGASALLTARGIQALRYWQPIVATLQNDATDDAIYKRLGYWPDTVGPERREYRTLGELLEPRPLDITDAMDALPKAPYFDWAHTNEQGAKAVARAMYADLGDLLASLDQPGSG